MTKKVEQALNIAVDAVANQLNLKFYPRRYSIEEIAGKIPKMVKEKLLTPDEALRFKGKCEESVRTLPIGTP
ncbi:MAG: hypothetical protein WC784_04450 [Candidatus Shapirobacteria bacterium]|jgi:hypothetical protein